ncbi:MAG: hypothetical protein D6820_07660, partial [Lentisphaerae bacterium]
MMNRNMSDNNCFQTEGWALLERWLNGMMKHQLDRTFGEFLAGGLLCPSCAHIHGRCADAVPAFLYAYERTGDNKYLEAAIALQDWSNRNVTLKDGSWINDVNGMWQGITVFGAFALSESLRLFGHLLPESVAAQWRQRLTAACDFLMDFMRIDTANINYPLSTGATLSSASLVLNRAEYGARGRELAHAGLAYFSDNLLIFGEGRPQNGFSHRGYRPVDLGYNVEE